MVIREVSTPVASTSASWLPLNDGNGISLPCGNDNGKVVRLEGRGRRRGSCGGGGEVGGGSGRLGVRCWDREKIGL